MKDLALFKRLIETPSPSGYEQLLLDLIQSSIGTPKPKDGNIRSRRFSNGLVYEFERHLGKPFTLIDIHVDTIHMRVKNVVQGKVLLCKPYGLAKKTLRSQNVFILREDDPIEGVIVETPIHVLSTTKDQDETILVRPLKQMTFDQSIIGTPIVFKTEFRAKDDYVVSSHLDNKCNTFVGIRFCKHAIRHFSSLKKNVLVHFAGLEEVGKMKYGLLFPYSIKDAIILDTCVAYDLKKSREEGLQVDFVVNVDDGILLSVNSEDSHELRKEVKQLLDEQGFPHQISLWEGIGSTNGSYFTRFIDRTLLLGIPALNLHYPNEIASKKVIEEMIEVLTVYFTS